MQMRWSLITLFALVAFIGEVCAAPLPSILSEDLVELEARGVIKPKASNYRANARNHAYSYHATPRGVNIIRAPAHGPQTPGHKRDADHLLEIQTLKHALVKQGRPWETLSDRHQKRIQGIVNHQRNMAFIDAKYNRGKGQINKHALRGKAIRRNPGRDNYFRATIPTAKRVARHVDAYLVNHNMQGNVHDTLLHTIRHSGVVPHGQTPGTAPNTPHPGALPGSTHNTPSGSPSHPAAVLSPGTQLFGGGGSRPSSPDMNALAAQFSQRLHVGPSGHHSGSDSEGAPDSPTPRNRQLPSSS